MVAAPTSAAIWVRAPMLSLTAVREPLAPTEKPWVKPAAALAAPIASSSCEARTCWPCLPAKERAVRISSAKATRKMPSAAGTSATMSPKGAGSEARSSEARPGSAPTTAMPWAWKSSAQESADRADDDDERRREASA